MAAKILIYDIETSPNLGYLWRAWKANVSNKFLIREWTMLSFSAKWLGSDKIIYADNRHQSNPLDDTQIVKQLYSLLCQADIVVAHNGIRFDNRRSNSRFLKLDLPPPPDYHEVDTLIEARKRFDLPHNSLDGLAKYLGLEPKYASPKFPGEELWLQCMAGNMEAWKEMEAYNRQDVRLLEQVYLRLRPWIRNHPNVALYAKELNTPTCNRCGSTDLQRRGVRRTKTQIYPRYFCKSCRGWIRGRFNVTPKEHKNNILIG